MSNIFKTANVTKMSKAILKSSYKVLEESPHLISCMIFKEKHLSGYIILTDQISLSGWFRKILGNMCIDIVC